MNISGSSYNYSYAGGLVTGQVNSSSNPAGVAIDENAKAQIRGTDVGTDNARAGQDMLKVADGALSNVTDMLGRMRELAVQASNSAVYSQDDKQAMQDEIDQLKQGISDAVRNTEFNTKKLFDGSMADANLATNPDGSGMSIQFENTSLKTLGIEDFSVMGEFDISKLDNAIAAVNKSRASLGAQSNVLDSARAYNTIASENLSSLTNRLEDVDTEQYVSERNKKQLLNLYQLYAQKMDVHSQESFINKMFGS